MSVFGLRADPDSAVIPSVKYIDAKADRKPHAEAKPSVEGQAAHQDDRRQGAKRRDDIDCRGLERSIKLRLLDAQYQNAQTNDCKGKQRYRSSTLSPTQRKQPPRRQRQ
jgi:hypothetical protein